MSCHVSYSVHGRQHHAVSRLMHCMPCSYHVTSRHITSCHVSCLAPHTRPGSKLFAKDSVFTAHLAGKAHKKAAAALATGAVDTKRELASRSLAQLEFRLQQWCELLRGVIQDTIAHITEKQTKTYEEMVAEEERAVAAEQAKVAAAEEDSEDDDDKVSKRHARMWRWHIVARVATCTVYACVHAPCLCCMLHAFPSSCPMCDIARCGSSPFVMSCHVISYHVMCHVSCGVYSPSTIRSTFLSAGMVNRSRSGCTSCMDSTSSTCVRYVEIIATLDVSGNTAQAARTTRRTHPAQESGKTKTCGCFTRVVCHLYRVSRHVSCVMCHVSCVMCHVSCCMCMLHVASLQLVTSNVISRNGDMYVPAAYCSRMLMRSSPP